MSITIGQLMNQAPRIAVPEIEDFYPVVFGNLLGRRIAPRKQAPNPSGKWNLVADRDVVPQDMERAEMEGFGEDTLTQSQGPDYNCLARGRSTKFDIDTLADWANFGIQYVQGAAVRLVKMAAQAEEQRVFQLLHCINLNTGVFDLALATARLVNTAIQVVDVSTGVQWDDFANTPTPVSTVRAARIDMTQAGYKPSDFICPEEVGMAIQGSDEYQAMYGNRDFFGEDNLGGRFLGMATQMSTETATFSDGTIRNFCHNAAVMTRLADANSPLYTGHAVQPVFRGAPTEVQEVSPTGAVVEMAVNIPGMPDDIVVRTHPDYQTDPSKVVKMTVDVGRSDQIIQWVNAKSPVTCILHDCLLA